MSTGVAESQADTSSIYSSSGHYDYEYGCVLFSYTLSNRGNQAINCTRWDADQNIQGN